MKAIKSMAKYIARNPALWIIGLIVPSAANLAGNLFFAYGVEAYTDQILQPDATLKKVAVIMLATLVSLLTATVIEDVARYLFALFITKTENNIKQDLYKSIISTRYSKLSRLDRGEMFTRYNADSATAANLISQDLFSVLFPIVLGTGYLISIFAENVLIGSIMLAIAVTVILLNIFFVKKAAAFGKELLLSKERFTLMCDGAIQGKMSLRQLSAGKMFAQKIREGAQSVYSDENKITDLNARRAITLEFFSTSCSTLMAPLACVLATLGFISVPGIVFIAQLCRYFIQFTNSFGVALTSFGAHSVSYERIKNILDLPDENAEGGEPVSFAEGNLLEFKNVFISYGERNILEDVNFSINPGEIVALVGPSGSGKSSIVKALLGLAEYDGEIDFYGKDIKQLSLNDLRKNISYVPERCDLFDATVLENLKCASQEADDEKIRGALTGSALDVEDGLLEKEVGESGGRLSGGQRQRVAIARALLKDAPVMILDEPTASLDTVSEGRVLETIAGLRERNKAIIIITHRESTMEIADRAFLINDRKINDGLSLSEAIGVIRARQDENNPVMSR